ALAATSSGYYGVAAVLIALVFAVVEPRSVRDRFRPYLVAAAIAVALLLPYLLAYRELQATEGLQRPVGMSVSMAFHPTTDLGSHGWLYGSVLGRGGERLFP